MEVQSIAVRSFEVIKPKDSSKPYVSYAIEIGTKLKSYKIHRRYSDFERLYASIKLELDPALCRRCLPSLPPKSTSLVGFLTGANNVMNDPSKIAERQAGLERWLKTVLVHKELKHQTSQSRSLLEFLELPSNLKSSSLPASNIDSADAIPRNPFTSQSWLAEHNEIRTSVRELYDSINRRDELLQAPTSSSASATLAEVNRINLDVKRTLANVSGRLARLTDSLQLFSQSSDPKGRTPVTEGEVARRLQLVSTLQDDCERLNKMSATARAEIGVGIRQTNQLLSSEATSRARAELLGGHHRSGTRPTTRVLGQPGSVVSNCPAEETRETRQRDNRQLMDHQIYQTIGQDQEAKLKSLTEILLRQKQIGLMINQELAEQNEILDDLDRDVDSASRKLKEARKKIDRLA